MDNKTLKNAWIDFLLKNENKYATKLVNQVKLILPQINIDLFNNIIDYCQLFIDLINENNTEQNKNNYQYLSNDISNHIVSQKNNYHYVSNDFLQTILPYLNDYQNKEFLALLYFHLPNDIIGDIIAYDGIDTVIREDIYQFMDDIKKQFDK